MIRSEESLIWNLPSECDCFWNPAPSSLLVNSRERGSQLCELRRSFQGLMRWYYNISYSRIAGWTLNKRERAAIYLRINVIADHTQIKMPCPKLSQSNIIFRRDDKSRIKFIIVLPFITLPAILKTNSQHRLRDTSFDKRIHWKEK